jgi:uncharacterized UPF0160 family protein
MQKNLSQELATHENLRPFTVFKFKKNFHSDIIFNFYTAIREFVMEVIKIPRSFGTHNGTFHADEVTACALLLLFNLIDRDKIVRTRDPQILSRCEYVCDVGGHYNPQLKLYDHHQAEYQGALSSAGMILLYLKEALIISEKEYAFFNSTLILGVDDHDNGRDPQIHGLSTYSHIISSFTPVLHDADNTFQDTAFFEALDFALPYLNRILNRYRYIQSCREIVAEKMQRQEEVLIFEKNIPWLEIFFELEGRTHPAKFVIMPSGKQWKLRGIPPTYEDRMKVRLPLPKEWAGLLDADLKKVSGIPGAIFCHKGRFISVWETCEDALKALNIVLGKSYDNHCIC